MVNRANQAGIVAVTDGIEIVGNAEPGQMLAQQRQKSRTFHNAAADKNGLRIEDMDEVIKAMAQAIEELGDQTLSNRVAGVIAVENQFACHAIQRRANILRIAMAQHPQSAVLIH